MDERENQTLEIHKTMLSELHSPTEGFKGRRLFSHLKNLRTSPPSREWLEASIIVGALKKARPNNTLNFIHKLRDMSETDEEKRQFENFSAAVAKYLSPILLTNHGFIDSQGTFGETSHEDIWIGLEKHLDVLKAEGLKVFLNSGTLLGLIRDGKLIGHDNDIDLGLILDADTEADAALEWARIPNKLRALGILSEESEEIHGLLRLTPVQGFTIDVFPAWIADNRVYIFPHTYGELKAEDLYPFKACEITGLDIPAAPEKILAVNYGSGWQTYDPLWKFSMPSSFSSFLKRIVPEK